MILNNTSDSLKILITNRNENNTVKSLLVDNHNFSSRLLSRLKRKNAILINDKNVTVNEKLKKDDIVRIIFHKEKINYKPEDIKLDILYEDGDLLILNKSSNMVVHPTKSHKNGTLANGIANYFLKNKIYKKIRFINRLDMDTSGIVLIAKNSYAHQYIQKQMISNEISKGYIAIITNEFPYNKGTIFLPIGKKEKGDIDRKVLKNGKKSITKFVTKEFFKKGAMVKIELVTGRTHQIRVHFAHFNNALLGDTLYGKTSKLIDRQALHSNYIKLKSPRKDKFIEIYSDIPDDIEVAINKLRRQ